MERNEPREGEWRRLLEKTQEGILVADLEKMKFRFANPAICAMLGYDNHQLTALGVEDIHPAESLPHVVSEFESQARGEKDIVVDIPCLRKDGTVFYADIATSKVEFEGIPCNVGFFRDVTDRKKILETLRDENKFTQTVLDTIGSIVIVLDPEGRIRRFNRLCEKVTGYSSKEVMGRHVWFLIPPERQNGVKEVFHDLKAGNFPNEYENEWVAKDGSRRLISWSNTALTDEDGGVNYVIATGVDITEHRQADELLGKAKQEWEETFDIINDAITIHDMDFNIVRANKAAEEILGIPLLKMRSQKCYTSYHGAECPPEGCPSCRTLKSGTATISEIFEPHLQKHIEIKALPRFDHDGNMKGLVHIVRDVTERKKAENERKAAQEQFLHSQKMESLGRVTGGIAHDFNNILSAIIGFSELLLLKKEDEDARREKIQIVKESGEKAAVLTKQLLAFSRKQVLTMKAVDMSSLVQGMAGMLGRIIGENIELDILAQSRSIIVADSGQMEQVVMNLVVNARDAMATGGKITLKTEDREVSGDGNVGNVPEPGLYVILSIADSGHGMSREVQQKIFEPFFTTKGEGRGTGLGLATVFGIVKQHGGHIFVNSNVGEGSTFLMYFPVRDEEVSKVESVKNQLPGGRETVIVVEDDSAARLFVVTLLRDLGYNCLEASNGKEAIEISDGFEGKIDLVLTDIIMPGMNGKDLSDRIAAARPGIKVIFMTGYADELVSRAGVHEDNRGFLKKPLHSAQIAEKLREILDT